MAASHFFIGLGAGIAILAVPAMAFTPAGSLPGRAVEWINGTSVQRFQLTNDDAASGRPQSGYRPGQATPPPATAPTLQAPQPTPVPTRALPATQNQTGPSGTSLRWSSSAVVRSGGARVSVRQVAGVDSASDPQIADGSPVLVAAGAPVRVGAEEWRAVRALNGVVGWVPSAQLAVDGETPPARPAILAAASASPAPQVAMKRGSIGNTGGVGVVLRNSPNDADRSRVGLAEGTLVTLVESSGSGWVRVLTDTGQSGWVLERYVKAG